MIRKMFSLFLTLAFVLCLAGCAEPEHKFSQEKEIRTETTPTDVSPGGMIVD